MFALIDCNNFYASCERLFRPDLREKPIVVLSNNDGCVIARSNEAKDLGIKMGVPYFQIKALSKQHHIQVFSSNYTLYGDLSHRVMSIIESCWADVEIYSIDEAFLDLSSMPAHLHDLFCSDLQRQILKSTGIPTSIGIGATKTLAKAANHLCKKTLKIPVFNITNQRHWLNQIAAGDVWGVGRQWQKKLMDRGVHTAQDLADLDPHMMRQQYNVVMMRTVMELQGVSCIALEALQAKKSIISSKSFGEMQTEFSALAQALSRHCARACEKARSQSLVAQRVYVFVRSNPFRADLVQYMNSMECRLVSPSDDTRVITKVATRCLNQLFEPGIHYKKVGVMIAELINKSHLQMDFFHQHSDEEIEKKDRLMSVFDTVNARYGSNTIKLAAEGFNHHWSMRSEMRSPCYTTQWSDLAFAQAF